MTDCLVDKASQWQHQELLLESGPWVPVTASATFSPDDSDQIILSVWLYKVEVTCNGRNRTPGCGARVLVVLWSLKSHFLVVIT